MKRSCQFDGCDRAAKSRGWCGGHYEQHRLGRAMSPLLPRSPRAASVFDRVAAQSSLQASGCLLWTGYVNKRTGYPMMTFGGEVFAVHAVLYRSEVGPVPAGRMIDHSCRNKRCVNVEHLHLVTRKQNGENVGLSRVNTSGARGVSFHAASGRWMAQVTHHGKKHYGGYFSTVEEAAKVARAMRMRLFTNNLADRQDAR